MSRTVRTIALGAALWLAAAVCAADDTTSDVVRIAVKGAGEGGSDVAMVTGVYRPAGDGPFPVLVYSHGRSGTESERAATTLPDPRNTYVRYWLKKGFAIVAPIRPGYGETGGPDHEASGVRYDVFGNCWGMPDFDRSAAAAARALVAALEWVREQPWADAKHIVLAGTSMGGLASIAMAASDPEGVAAYVNFAGGTGGNGSRSPQNSCGSEDMEALMSRYGKTTHVPSLWLYAENDSFWGSQWPRVWHHAFAKGGSATSLVVTEPVPYADGHQLLARGTRLWTAVVDRFLHDLGLAAN